MSGAPAQENLPVALRLARFHEQRPAARSVLVDLNYSTPDAAVMAIELLRRELMQLTAVVAEQNRMIREMHQRLGLSSGFNDAGTVLEGTASRIAAPIAAYTIGVGREAYAPPSDPPRRRLGRGLEALFHSQHQAAHEDQATDSAAH